MARRDTRNPYNSLAARQAAARQAAARRRELTIQFQRSLRPPSPPSPPGHTFGSPIVSDPYTVPKPWLGQAPKGFARQQRLPLHLSQATQADPRTRGRSYFVNPAQTSGRPNTPRTLRYAYDAANKELHVVFRDGTPWVYEGVTPEMARDLRRSQSVGQFIIRRLDPRGPSTYHRGAFSPADPYLGIFPENAAERGEQR